MLVVRDTTTVPYGLEYEPYVYHDQCMEWMMMCNNVVRLATLSLYSYRNVARLAMSCLASPRHAHATTKAQLDSYY